jgi:hypothetical protein
VDVVKRIVLSLVLGFAAGAFVPADAKTLESFAELPADTFAAGPTSGQLIATANGRVPPFIDQQPIQGPRRYWPARTATSG